MIETVRDPAGFVAALEKAQDRRVPVVALKVGRSALGARLAQSHSGAIAGNDAAYQAAFERYGVVRVGDIDELLATLLLFAEPARPGPGRLSVISDSGGERELFVDMAEEMGVPFAQISEHTVARLDAVLEPDLARVNPLDAWGSPHDYEAIFGECFDALVSDPDAAMGLVISDVLTGFGASETWGRMAVRTLGRHTKPIAIAALYAATNHGDFGERITKAGVPVIYGAAAALKAVRNMLAYRDAPPRPDPGPGAPVAAVATWRGRLATGTSFNEAESLALLSDFGIPTQPARVAESVEEAATAARELGYPVALKTARPGLAHKSEAGGVKLGLADEPALWEAYCDLRARLGPRVLVAPMAGAGVEMALGVVVDPQFGPLVMAGAGGELVEFHKDTRFALAPLDAAAALRLIEGLAVRPLLDGVRGRPGADMAALVDVILRLAALADALGDVLAEIDVNPFIAGTDGGVAVDALVIPKRR
jgi:acyl-CoA synthetase (NDP forming)